MVARRDFKKSSLKVGSRPGLAPAVTPARKLYSAPDIKLLKQHSKARTPVLKISKQMKRSLRSLKQKALHLGIGLGHQR